MEWILRTIVWTLIFQSRQVFKIYACVPNKRGGSWGGGRVALIIGWLEIFRLSNKWGEGSN